MSAPVPRLGYDASCTLAPRTGVGRYALELLEALVAHVPDRLRLVVLLNSVRHAPGLAHAFLQNREGVALARRRVPGPALVRGWAAVRWPSFEMLTGHAVDVVHSPGGYLVPTGGASVATIHDLAFQREDPATWEPLGNGLYARDWPVRLPDCDAVVVDSAFVRGDLMATIPAVPEHRIHVVPPGISRSWFEPAPPYRHGGGTPYFLAITGEEPRKRRDLLRAAYQRARAMLGGDAPALVMVGAHGSDELPGEVPIPRGTVDDSGMRSLYAGALVLVVASREEGFGFPVLEAMAQGTPVLCGRNSALPEVAGPHAFWWEPETEECLAARMAAIARGEWPRPARTLLAAHAATFTWARAAEAMLAVYEAALKERRQRG